jgi:hypothetical protein
VKPGSELHDLREDLTRTFAPLASITVEEFTNPAAANAAGLEAATATTVAPRTVTTFVAGGVAALAAFGRNVTFTTAGDTPADAPASATVTGKDIDGKAQTETINLSQTADIVAGAKIFKSVSSVAYAAAGGTDATVSIGFGDLLGLTKTPKARAGLAALVREIAAGSLVTNGVLNAANRSYAPNSVPDGTRDYAVYYEYAAD